ISVIRTLVFEFYTLSLHDALPICFVHNLLLGGHNMMTLASKEEQIVRDYMDEVYQAVLDRNPGETEFHQAVKTTFESLLPVFVRSEEHTSELQSRFDLVCRLLLEK